MTRILWYLFSLGVFFWITVRAVTMDPELRDELNMWTEWLSELTRGQRRNQRP